MDVLIAHCPAGWGKRPLDVFPGLIFKGRHGFENGSGLLLD
jgi:hypothetical protein